METSSRKQSFSQALSIAIPEADGLTGTWARVPGAVVPFPEPHDTPPAVHPTVILANAVNLGGHVRVDDYAIIGGMTPVHQFVTIGCHAFVGGASRVPQDVPPYVKAAGNPLRACGLNSIGMDRRGIPAEVRLEVKRAYRILYRSQLNVAQALSRIA